MRTCKLKLIIHSFSEITSTNDIAKDYAQRDCPEGTVIVAKSQTSGKGRGHNRWISPCGGLYLSLILRPQIEISSLSLLPIFFSGTITDFVNDKYSISVNLKWPNDILNDNKKLGGILIESAISENKIEFLVVGVGINLNVKPIDPYLEGRIITSLAHIRGSTINIDEFRMEFLDNLMSKYVDFIHLSSNAKKQKILDLWNRTRDESEMITIIRNGAKLDCKIINLNDDGTLKVKLPDGLIENLVAEQII